MSDEETAVISALAGIQDQLQTRGVRARTMRVVGVPHEEILNSVTLEKIDLVVMGTRGRRGLTRLVLGSVAAKVVRVSQAPVLVCRAVEQARETGAVVGSLSPADELEPIRTILVPTDLEASSEGAVCSAFELARQLGATVHLFHAYPAVVTLGEGGVGAIQHEALNRRARERLHAIAKPYEGSFNLGECLAVLGEPSLAIIETAAELKADMIIMGTHGRSGIKRAFLGSVVEKIIREADCAVMVVKPKPAIHELTLRKAKTA
jgi:nucleotide-binding universal stress UspA family protein